MYHMVIFVMNHPDECGTLLETWEAAGVTGITILESSGLGRLRGRAAHDDIPLMPSLHDIFKTKETRHRTLFSVVDSEENVDAILKATQEVVGDLDCEDTGFLFVLPVSRAYGMSRPSGEAEC